MCDECCFRGRENIYRWVGEVDVEICGLLFWVLGMAHGFSGFLAVLLEVGT